VRKLVVLPRRAPASAALYQRIWTAEGSPLVVESRRFAAALARTLGDGFRVELAMRYGEPAIGPALAALARAGCRRVLLFTAFPQASNASTLTTEREVERVRRASAPELELLCVPPYYADPGFVAALAAAVRAALGPRPWPHLVQSYHGYPVRYVEAGDPYRDHCEATARALAAALELGPNEWTLAYQSRFGREPWLEPDTAEVVPRLAARGRVAVCAPSFTADCLETLEELDLRLPESLPPGAELVRVPCLNAAPEWVAAGAALVRSALARAAQA
jgi:ferrochelatase